MKIPFKKATPSFEKIDKMVTRRLPIPGVEYPFCHIQIVAKQDKGGGWTLYLSAMALPETLGESKDAVNAIVYKHSKYTPDGEPVRVNFEEAYMILREIEEAHLTGYAGEIQAAPRDHYAAVAALLPPEAQASLEDIYQMRLRNPEILVRSPPSSRGKNSSGLQSTP